MSGAYDTNLNCSAFLSKHSPDMRFTYCQPRVFQLTGYTETDLLGHSVYQYYHASDCQHVHKAHLSLFSKGQTSTGKYRLLVKHGGYVWVETVATVVYNSRTGQLQSVICINYILSEVEQSGVMFSLEQMERLLKPLASSPAPVSPLLLPGAILLDELSQKAADPRDSESPGGSTWTREYEGHLNDIPEKDNFTTCHKGSNHMAKQHTKLRTWRLWLHISQWMEKTSSSLPFQTWRELSMKGRNSSIPSPSPSQTWRLRAMPPPSHTSTTCGHV
ncbi:hypothetical protein ANANG_G00158160 [Anguilla anguilla]|uniref:Hypoxia-inducible factor 1-alpha n=1 Tax=Anguilla anguilla TaxID=7936 RepID=A0A9D3RV01_ANGAN|nr:hypothetical protein ANANG_G00158160 [Anguilla anguilla]